MQSNYTWGSEDPAGAAPEVEYAGFWVRAGARIIDTILLTVLSAIVGMILGIIGGILQAVGMLDPAWLTRVQGVSLLGYLFGTLGFISYHALSEWLGGASIGKLILGLRVMNEDLQPCTFGGGLIRSAAYLIDGFCIGLVAYMTMNKSYRQQRLGDQWGRTVVVKASTAPASGKRSGTEILMGLAAGLAVSSLMSAATIVVKWFV